jgi:hypothetical protein
VAIRGLNFEDLEETRALNGHDFQPCRAGMKVTLSSRAKKIIVIPSEEDHPRSGRSSQSRELLFDRVKKTAGPSTRRMIREANPPAWSE